MKHCIRQCPPVFLLRKIWGRHWQRCRQRQNYLLVVLHHRQQQWVAWRLLSMLMDWARMMPAGLPMSLSWFRTKVLRRWMNWLPIWDVRYLPDLHLELIWKTWMPPISLWQKAVSVQQKRPHIYLPWWMNWATVVLMLVQFYREKQECHFLNLWKMVIVWQMYWISWWILSMVIRQH